MRLSKDHDPLTWESFSRLVNIHFSPSTHHNPLGELAALRNMGFVDEYTKKFLTLFAPAGKLDEIQQVSIYITRLTEPLKTDIELWPKDMEETMSFARAYVVAEVGQHVAT